MMPRVTTFLWLAVVADAKMPSFETQHHDALTGRGKYNMPDLFIKGHVRDDFVMQPHRGPHHDALTGSSPRLPDLNVKGHVRDNFVIQPHSGPHHGALTGQGPRIPDLHIKGHVSDPLPYYRDDSVTNPMVGYNSIPAISQEVPFCQVSGDRCSQYTLDMQWAWLATTVGGFKQGTCWENGYNVNDGSKEISMPWIGKTNVRFFKEANKEIPVEVLAQTSPDGVSVLALALISLIVVSGGVVAMFRLRHGTSMVNKEALLATSRF